MKDIKIIIATHKKYEMPTEDIYLPLHVGAEGKKDETGKQLDFGYQRDNEGDNISSLNYCFGTQCAMYWAWKNLKADYVGLVHYRRYFTQGKVDPDNRLASILNREQLEHLLEDYKVIVPRKRKYYIFTIYDQYTSTMNGGKEQLDTTRSIIGELSPEYLNSFDKYMKCRSGYVFNMMILPKTLFDDYCKWLFSVLFELYKRIDQTGMSDFDKRYAGRISERLFNVWLLAKMEEGCLSKSDIKELQYTEEVNWKKKVKSFVMAKVFKKKYGASF